MSAALGPLLVLLGAALQGSGTAPLRKSDLVRLLSGAMMAPAELTQLVRRNCLTFAPTDRDRNDFRALGAEPLLLAAVDECARRSARPRRVTTSGSTPKRRAVPRAAPAALPPAVVQVQRINERAAVERSGFVSGGGQRGVVGIQLPRALIFEARDSVGAVVSGQAVTFTGINARIQPPLAPTDAAGQVRVGITLGERVGPATVIASIGVVEKQVAFNVVADARIFRVLRAGQDSVAGTVVLKPDQPGTTSLAVIANGMRQYLTVTVPPKAASGKVDCR